MHVCSQLFEDVVDILDPEMNLADDAVEEEDEAAASESSAALSHKLKAQSSEKADENK